MLSMTTRSYVATPRVGGQRWVRTLKFASKNSSLSVPLLSFGASGGGLTAFDGVDPLLLTPFWTGLPEARCVIGFMDVRVHAAGLTKAPMVNNDS
jgi:hypothetical protein